MAHEIYDEQFAFVGQQAWHGLGQQCPEGSTAEDLLVAAKLDWEINSAPMVAKLDNGWELDIPNRKAFIRSTDNKLMTIASDDWKPFQNRDSAKFVDAYCEAGKASAECAGALRDGQVIWFLANLGHSFEIRPGDKTQGYLAITVPHVAGQAIKIRTTTVRIVCQNTMNLAERNSPTIYKQNHLSEFNVDAARAAIAAAHEDLSFQEKKLKALDMLKMSIEDAVIKVLIPSFLPEMHLLDEEDLYQAMTNSSKMPKKLAELVNSIYTAPGATPETGYGILNGATHWATHVAGSSQSSRIYNNLVGSNGKSVLEAEKLLLELAGF